MSGGCPALRVSLALAVVGVGAAAAVDPAACARERAKIAAEAAVRGGTGVLWHKHVQKSGRHAICEVARSFALFSTKTIVRVPGVVATVPSNRCGDWRVDAYLDGLASAGAARAVLAASGAAFWAHEFGNRTHAPDPRAMAYVAALREPVAWFRSWARRFGGPAGTAAPPYDPVRASLARQLGGYVAGDRLGNATAGSPRNDGPFRRAPPPTAADLLAAAKAYVDAASAVVPIDAAPTAAGLAALRRLGFGGPGLADALAANANRTRASNVALLRAGADRGAHAADAALYDYARGHAERQDARRRACGL